MIALAHFKLHLSVLAACSGLLACHEVCEREVVAEGTTFKVTVLAASSDCPEIVPLKAGDTLTMRAGAVWSKGGDGICTGNSSTGAPPELAQFPVSTFEMGACSEDPIGIGFDCKATAPDCATGDIARQGHVSGFLNLSRYPKLGETISTHLTFTVSVGADASCTSECFTKIPITVELL